MSYQGIIVLYPSHGLEDFPTDLPDDKAAGLLNAFAVAWHPALLAAVKSLPTEHRADVPPSVTSERLILVPPASQEMVPAGWIDQARAEGATVITDATTRDDFFRSLSALPEFAPTVDADIVGDFLALGTCRLMLELLTRRMHHFGPLDEGRLEREAIAAAESAVAGAGAGAGAGDLSEAETHLQNCVEVLVEARERFYPVECYLLDLCLLIPRLADAHLAAALSAPAPLNILLSGADLAQITGEKPEIGDQVRRALEAGTLDVLGGEWHERPVPLLPVPSLLREFERGHAAFLQCLGPSPRTWARRRYGFSTLLPQILHRYGYQGALHVPLDDGLYPDSEQSKVRWEGSDGTVIDACTRIPLAAESASSYLRFPSRMAESMQQDQTAAVILARWPEVHSPFWEDLQRIHQYAPVLGRFVTFCEFFEHAEDPGRISRFEESEYLTPFLIQAVAALEPDAISRFQRFFERRARFDAATFLDGLASIISEQPLAIPAAEELEDRLEMSGPDLPTDKETTAPAPLDDAEINASVDRSARRLGEMILAGSARQPGYLVLNTLSFDRTVTVELPKLEIAPPLESPIRGVQIDGRHRSVTVDLPGCGYVWIPSRGPTPTRSKGTLPPMAEGPMIRNEFIEVHVNEETGGIGRIKEFGRKPNRLSQQLAFRFPRERTIRSGTSDAGHDERTYYSLMRCSSIAVTSSGPALGEIVTAGTLIDPEDGSILAEFGQTVRLWKGRPIIEVEIELRPTRLPDGDPWTNYFASRFAWNDSSATLTRGVLGGAHRFQFERFESPHFLEIATESQRTTILNHGLPFHRKTGPRMVDSILIVAGEREKKFRFGIAVDRDYPLQPATDVLCPPAVIETTSGPPSAGRSGWLFHLDAKNVQILQVLPLAEPEPADEDVASTDDSGHHENAPSGFGFRMRLYETEGRHRTVQLRCFRTPTYACQRDFRGRLVSTLRIVDDAVHLDTTPYEIIDIELRFGDGPIEPAVHS